MIRALIFDYYGVIRPNGFRLPGKQNDEVLLAYIATLQKQYKIGLLSNVESSGRLRALLEPYRAADYFDEVLASGDTDYAKPDPRIYRLIAERLGVAPEECAMIDDSADYSQGVQDAGMQPIVYQSLALLQDEVARLPNA